MVLLILVLLAKKQLNSKENNNLYRMKIYTKTGDKGQTALYGGTRLSKADVRVETYGTCDELNSFVGLAKSQLQDKKILEQLAVIQWDLFVVGSEIATPTNKMLLANGKARLSHLVEEEKIKLLEDWMDEMEEQLPALQYFILPGGTKAACYLHVCRTVCRRAERLCVALDSQELLRPECIKYLNRLSDYFFVLARFVSKLENEKEEYWIP